MSIELTFREEFAVLQINRPKVLKNAACAFAREFTCYGGLALQFAKEAVQQASTTTLTEGLRAEADLSTLAYRTADAEEGMKAFVERRSPVFRGI